MIDLASPDFRKLLPTAKSIAMLGEPSRAITILEAAVLASNVRIDKLVALLAICEILHFDFRDADALELFDRQIAPLAGSFPEKIEIAIAFNRSDIQFALLQPDDYYGVVDRAEISEIEHSDYRALYGVVEAREQGKRFDSLPRIWRELWRTYRQGCWRPYRMASKLMAVECMELGWPHEAVFHSIIAEQNDVAIRLGDLLLTRATATDLSAATAKWLACTNLKRQFTVGCEILDRFIDAIPDPMFGSVFEQVLQKASLHSSSVQEHAMVSRAWNSMANLSWRLDSPQAQQLVKAAVEHPIWNAAIEGGDRVLTVRDKIIQSLTNCVAKLPATCISELINASLPLCLERMQHTDYPVAINLMCHIAHFGGEDAQRRIRESLYPSGHRLNAYLLQVSSNFGVEIKKPESLSQDAKNVAARIRQQVQLVPAATDVKQLPGTFGFQSVVIGDNKRVVHISDSVHVQAILRHRQQLSADALQDLTNAILEMLREKNNLLSNKCQLVQAMEEIGDCCTDVQAQQIFNVLAPFAIGEIAEPELTMSAAESQNPLNPFKFGSGKPVELQGVSIHVLACIERDKPGVFEQRLDSLIELGLSSAEAHVRAWAIAAARERPTISESEVAAIILATRDFDPSVVSAAFGVLANKDGLQFTRPQWQLLIHAARLATYSAFVNVRRTAAFMCSKLRGRLTTTLSKQMDEVINAFADDKCKSVRDSTTIL